MPWQRLKLTPSEKHLKHPLNKVLWQSKSLLSMLVKIIFNTPAKDQN
jgi:hypothetical protein